MFCIEPLADTHNRQGFHCGAHALNYYLGKTAKQHQNKGISGTFILIDDEKPTEILGYYTVAICNVILENMPSSFAKKYPDHIYGAKLGRLAIADHCKRQGHGTTLLMDAMAQTVKVADTIGLVAFFVDAKDNDAAEFYRQFGFDRCCDDPLKLFLPFDTIRKEFPK